MPTAYGPPGASGGTPQTPGPWMPTPLVVTDRPEWFPAAQEARQVALDSMPPCKCMGPKVAITDDGNGPLLHILWDHDIDVGDRDRMGSAVGTLGWRGWVYSDRGISFKPTWVDLR